MTNTTGEAKESLPLAVHKSQDVDVQFHLKEFELLKDEIKRRSDEQMTSERLTAIACAAVYSFTVTIWNQDVRSSLFLGFLLLWWIPPIIIYYSSVRWRLNGWMIANIGNYIKVKLEPLLANNGKGWECTNATYETNHKNTTETQSAADTNKLKTIFKRLMISFKSTYEKWGTLEKVRSLMLIGATALALVQTILLTLAQFCCR